MLIRVLYAALLKVDAGSACLPEPIQMSERFTQSIFYAASPIVQMLRPLFNVGSEKTLVMQLGED